MMGTHGRRDMQHRWPGSIAEEVVRTAPCTVFTLREKVEPKSLADSLQRVTVPIDFSPESLGTLAYAKKLASFYEAQLEILHIIEQKPVPAFYEKEKANEPLETDYLKDRLVEHMQKLYETARGEEGEVAFTVRYGHPVAEIVHRTAQAGTDLIVIAIHGLSANRRSGVGSVAERVARLAECPVLTVKAPVEGSEPNDLFDAPGVDSHIKV
jgi:nucleotide-binding universal stress UspA family protein